MTLTYINPNLPGNDYIPFQDYIRHVRLAKFQADIVGGHINHAISKQTEVLEMEFSFLACKHNCKIYIFKVSCFLSNCQAGTSFRKKLEETE